MKTVYNVWYGSELVDCRGKVKRGVEDLVATFDSKEKATQYIRECVNMMRNHPEWEGEFIKNIPDGDIHMDTKIICTIYSDRTAQTYFRFASYNVR